MAVVANVRRCNIGSAVADRLHNTRDLPFFRSTQYGHTSVLEASDFAFDVTFAELGSRKLAEPLTEI